MNRQQVTQEPNTVEDRKVSHRLANEDGSAIVLVIMVLAIMTVIGIVSSNTVVTENFIVRNVAINKQNENLAESALMEGLQTFMQIDDGDPDNFDASSVVWINDVKATATTLNPLPNDDRWYETSFTGRCLTASNSNVANSMALLNTRGESANSNLRYAVIGYSAAEGESVVVGGSDPVWRTGRIVAEYVSVDASNNDNGFGLMRMEIGVRRKW